MKVIEVNVYVVDTGGFRPPIVELITDEGITGIGEGAVGFGIGCYAAGTMMSDLAENFVLGKIHLTSTVSGMIFIFIHSGERAEVRFSTRR